MRVVGVDPGARRIGLALSDDDGLIASPHATIEVRSREQAVTELRQRVAELQVRRVVVGLPLRLDGSEGEAARRARRFAEALSKGSEPPLEVVLWDERMTTVSAERSLRDAGVRRGKRRSLVDQVAAALLLQSYLDAERGARGRRPDAD